MAPTTVRKPIPDSVLPYPRGVKNRAKYFFWKVVSPVHTTGRDLLLSLRILRHEGRQNYPIGMIAPGKSVEDFVTYLESQRFLNYSIALKDDGELVSVRRVMDFEHQYHLRIFDDGEVRGHYEYTTESHPAWHMDKVGQIPRREDFLKLLGTWIIPIEIDESQVSGKKQPSITRILGRNPFGSQR